MDIGPLLIEQRRVGDEYRRAERKLEAFAAQLVTPGLEAGARAEIEAAVDDAQAVLKVLWDRMLELDAAVTASAFKSGDP